MCNNVCYVIIYHQVFPAVYCLMTRKTRVAYSAFLNYCKRELNINPRVIITDYEQALQGAAAEVFPEAHLTGCLFHYGQVSLSKVYSTQISVALLSSTLS